MIVARYFEGDDDDDLAWRQHDVYPRALRSITDTCNGLTRFSRSLLGDKSPSLWGTISRYDHRTLQLHHDLLAAAWRYRIDSRQGKFPFDPQFLTVDEPLETHWLTWLRLEVESWWKDFLLVQQVQIILENQNSDAGYKAETRLASELLRRFSDVPWTPEWTKAIGADARAELVEDTESDCEDESETESPICECVQAGRPACCTIPCRTMAIRAEREGWGPVE